MSSTPEVEPGPYAGVAESEPGACMGGSESEPVGGGLIFIDDGIIFIDGGRILLGGAEGSTNPESEPGACMGSVEVEPGPCMGLAESFDVIDNNGTLVVASGGQVKVLVD